MSTSKNMIAHTNIKMQNMQLGVSAVVWKRVTTCSPVLFFCPLHHETETQAQLENASYMYCKLQ